ncbi:MAG: hypothetical protein ACLGSD_12470 [Acidobacteriota bacterium]
MKAISSVEPQPVRLKLLGVALATLAYCITEQFWRHQKLYWYEALAWAAGCSIAVFGNLWVGKIWKKWQNRNSSAAFH